LQTWRTPRLDSQPWRLAILTAQQSAPASSRPTYWCAHSCKKINRLTTDGYRLSLRGLRTITPGNAYPTPGDVLLLTIRAARQFMRLPAIRVAPGPCRAGDIRLSRRHIATDGKQCDCTGYHKVFEAVVHGLDRDRHHAYRAVVQHTTVPRCACSVNGSSD